MLIDTREPERIPWQPRWNVVTWAVAAIVIGVAGASAGDAIGTLLVFVAFACACRAVDLALPYREGLREWRQ